MLIKKSPEAIAKWKQTVCLEIKKEAKNIGATIYFEDEAGIRFDFHSGKTWAPVSKTPVIEATGARFGLNMIAAISTLGHMRFMVVKDSVDSERICEFLNRLMHNADNPIFLVGYFNRRVYSIHKNAHMHAHPQKHGGKEHTHTHGNDF